ncbi:MAG: glycosyltransferase family 2 protein [Patescibacteria group bacterium]
MPKLISVVVPIYNEEKNIPRVYAEIKKTFESLAFDLELIFVNDGSQDHSFLEINKLAEKDSRVKLVDFARNFGKEIALTAGCHHASGEAVITMDADLQHPPKLIPEMLEKWQSGKEVVYTVRKEHKGASLTKKTTSKLYWWLFQNMTSVETEPHSTDFRLMDKKVIDIFKKFPERGRIFRGIIDWIGFERERIEFVAPERTEGKPTYSYRKLIGLAINSLTAFSMLPLRLAGYLGVIITLVSSLILFIIALSKIFGFLEFTPIASLTVVNTFLIGIVLVCLGFIALYIARIHDEVIDRPLYLIKRKLNLENDGSSGKKIN